jgi:hypothetical protein
MEKTDVLVWADGEDGAGASVAVNALKARLKASVGEWYLLGVKTDRWESLAHMTGMKLLIRPPSLGGLGALALLNGDSPSVLFWSAEAVLVSDWNPWQGNHVRLWESCPAALLRRSDLPGGPAATWSDLQKQTSWPSLPLPPAQVKVVAAKEFEKSTQGSSWPFGPSVMILEKPTLRR